LATARRNLGWDRWWFSLWLGRGKRRWWKTVFYQV